MYHVLDPRTSHHVFTFDDPRQNGFDGHVQEDVNLLEPEDVFDWPDGAPKPDVCLGVSHNNARQYQVFKTTIKCHNSGFRLLGPNYIYVVSWAKKWQ